MTIPAKLVQDLMSSPNPAVKSSFSMPPPL